MGSVANSRPRSWSRAQAQQKRLVIPAQSPPVFIDDGFQTRALRLDVEQLVHLLLVLGHREAGVGVIEDVRQLSLGRVLVEGNGNAAQRLGGHDRPVELGPVVAHDGGPIAPREAERGQPQGDEAALLEVLPPGVGLPDAEILLADGNLVGPAARRSGGRAWGRCRRRPNRLRGASWCGSLDPRLSRREGRLSGCESLAKATGVSSKRVGMTGTYVLPSRGFDGRERAC